MRRKSIKQNSGDFSDHKRNTDHDYNIPQDLDKDKRQIEQYKCGKIQCGKLYHSYTAFYNHCKKSHEGVFPANSIYNGKNFQGPSKNRGRPRIKKTDAKDSIQIQSLKTENELIQFLGTLPKKKKNEELIVYVANPIEQLNLAIETMNQYKREEVLMGCKLFISDLLQLNEIVSKHDLPDFYDPIEIEKYADKLDSYNFLSIYNFLTDKLKANYHKISEKDISLMRKIIVIWLARILSVSLLAEIVYTVAQINKQVQKLDQKQYMVGKSFKFKQLIQKYFQCIINQQSNLKCYDQSNEDL